MAFDQTILRETSFSGNGVHGGFRRSMQVEYLLNQAGFEVKGTIPHGPQWPRSERVPAGIRFLARHRYPIQRSKTELGHCGISVLRVEQSLREHRGAKVLIWEAASNPLTPIVARDHGYKVIAVPHNIESLAQAGLTPACRLHGMDRLQLELQWLAACDATFCIAREECWLLANADIQSGYLPYFPPPHLLTRLMEIRERRQSTEKRGFLLLGTANNPPTAAGMIDLIRWFEGDGSFGSDELAIVGDGTELLSSHLSSNSKIKLMGRASDEALDEMLGRTRGIVAHQLKGAGALTRIPEALIAGIPVLANSIASRSAWGLSGVHSYDGIEELRSIMAADLETPPMPARPESAEKAFKDSVVSLVKQSRLLV